MTRKRFAPRRTTLSLCAALLVTFSFAAFGLAPAHGQEIGAKKPVVQERSAADVLEDLTPSLRSEIPAVRAQAEKKLFALGQPGRDELQRWAKGDDPALSSLALRLLQRDEWEQVSRAQEKSRRKGGKLPLEDEFDEVRNDWQKQLQRLQEQLRGRFRQHIDLSGLENDDDGSSATSSSSSSGKIIENGREFGWTKHADGRIDVTVKDGKDAPSKKFTFESLDAAKKSEPEIAKRLEKALTRVRAPSIRFRFGNDWQELSDFDFEAPDLDGWRRSLRDWIDPDSAESRATRDTTSADRPLLGIRFELPSDVLRSQLSLGKSGLVITDVVKGTNAAKLGLAKHDVLIDVAGKPIASSQDIWSALKAHDTSKPLIATVLRKGKRVTLTSDK